MKARGKRSPRVNAWNSPGDAESTAFVNRSALKLSLPIAAPMLPAPIVTAFFDPSSALSRSMAPGCARLVLSPVTLIDAVTLASGNSRISDRVLSIPVASKVSSPPSLCTRNGGATAARTI